MTPADKRVMELLDRWLTSIELHMKYADLDDVSYQQMQPWPRHERPARWILELAQQKVLSLQTLCKTHRSEDDPSFAESLELMCFLANLVGAQHIQRFIPLAVPEREAKPETGMHRALQTGSMTARSATVPDREVKPETGMHRALQTGSMAARPTAPQPVKPAPAAHAASVTVPAPSVPTPRPAVAPSAPAVVPAPASFTPAAPPVIKAPVTVTPPRSPAATVVQIPTAAPASKPADEGDRTREMPRLRPTRQRHQPSKAAEPARRLNIKSAAPTAAKSQPANNGHVDEVVIADAVRLLKWGRQWHEIAELIARMAERPGISEVRKILRSHKPAIEQQLEA